jgi:hypothetical protein
LFKLVLSCAKNCGLDEDGAGACGTILVEDDVSIGILLLPEDMLLLDMSTGFGTLEGSILVSMEDREPAEVATSALGAGLGALLDGAGADVEWADAGELATSSPL